MERWDRRQAIGRLAGFLVILGLAACAGMGHARTVYDEGGIQIGIQRDASTKTTSPPTANNHPARMAPEEIRKLLGMLRVSGYSGIVAGLVVAPTPIPVFTEEELGRIAAPLAAALRQAGPEERIWFSLPNSRAPYERDRTSGTLFLRGPYLHLTLSDHAAFTRADTGGGEDDRDFRDTKGLKLFVSSPGRVAAPPPKDTPHWDAFEKAHVSVNVQDALTARALPAPLPPAPTKPAQERPPDPSARDSGEDLRVQLRELTNANLDLRDKLKQQAEAIESLKDELARLKQDSQKTKPKSQPGKKKLRP